MQQGFKTGPIACLWVALAQVTGAPSFAQLCDPCPYLGDGDCDEPNGLGLCAYGTDTVDCSNSASYYGSGTGYRPGSSVYNPNTQNTGSYLLNPCPYLNDGDCDEPNGLGLCDWGTDRADCADPASNYGGGSGYGTRPGQTPPVGGFVTLPGNVTLLNPCPYLNDGDCDEPEGLNLCAEGTDVADCANRNSNYGGGPGYQGAGGTGATGAQPPSAPALPFLNLSGHWSLRANQTSGDMELFCVGGCQDYAGIVDFTGYLNLDGRNENVIVRLDTRTRQVTFSRRLGYHRVEQAYTGTATERSMSGTFTQGGVGSYSWTASR